MVKYVIKDKFKSCTEGQACLQTIAFSNYSTRCSSFHATTFICYYTAI